jgi:cytidine deaminase
MSTTEWTFLLSRWDMKENKFEFRYNVYSNIGELSMDKQLLIQEARRSTNNAYAPYSNFNVAAVAQLANGEIVRGTNQENASSPVGLCAERVLLATISSMYPDTPIDTIAISYNTERVKSDHPISPCGVCRQSLQEVEGKNGKAIKLLLSGMEGEVYELDSATNLLPLAFTSNELK